MGLNDPSAWIDIIVRRADELRRAGVSSVKVEGCAVELRPPDPTPVEVEEEPEPEPVPLRPYTEGVHGRR